MAAGRVLRTERAEETRERIRSAAERLFAEHGVLGVSNRQISEAAGQGNNFAVGYHFGTKTDLVRAVARRHGEPMQRARAQMLAALGPDPDLRDWLDCLVRPVTRHLDALGSPSWCARFTAQVTTEPTLRALAVEDAVAEPALRAVLDGLHACLPALPGPVQAERSAMVRQLVVHTCAERERDLAAGVPTPRASWDEAADGLVDAMAGLLLAPSIPRTGRNHHRGARVTEPEITGPVPGTAAIAGAPHALPGGYVEEEFLLRGTATAYRGVGDLGADGRWTTEPADRAEYVTRLLVRRPAEERLHDGTVVVEWLNVSAGADACPEWMLSQRQLGRAGTAWVGVSAQRVGIEGAGGSAMGAGLHHIAPQRYGQLVHPGDAWSYDMFTQAARVVRAGGVLGPLRAQRLIAAGVSQSAACLVTYLNGVAPHVRAFDAYLVHSRGGGSVPLGGVPVATDGGVDLGSIRGGDVLLRTDLGVPVLTLETETDLIALGFAAARQPDTDLLRLWEVAGTAHADTYLRAGPQHRDDTTVAELARLCAPTTTPFGPAAPTEVPINAGVQHHYVAQAALAHLDRWVREGAPAPVAPRLELAGEPPELVTDELGIARGGIRTGFVDVPAAVLSGLGQTGMTFAMLFGTTRALDADTLRGLYPGGRDEYAKRFAEATAQAVDDGFVLAADAAEMTALAVEMYPAQSAGR